VRERFGVGFSAGPGKTCCRNKRQQEEWLGVGGTFLWDFTYLCWNLTEEIIKQNQGFEISRLLNQQQEQEQHPGIDR